MTEIEYLEQINTTLEKILQSVCECNKYPQEIEMNIVKIDGEKRAICPICGKYHGVVE